MNYWEVSLMDCQIKITDNKAVWKIQAALALIFLLNPFLGVRQHCFLFLFQKKNQWHSTWSLFLPCSCGVCSLHGHSI